MDGKWTIPKEGSVGFIKHSSGKVMTIKGDNPDSGAEIYLKEIGSQPERNQQWSRMKTKDGYFTLKHMVSGKCLTSFDEKTIIMGEYHIYHTKSLEQIYSHNKS